MSDDPGPLMAAGRAADVYDVGNGRVLRRYRDAGADTEREAHTMEFVAEHGYPVPAVHDADGPDLVMDRIDGPTMFDDLTARPHTVLAHARRLARLQEQLAAIHAPDWLMAPGWTPDPDGDRVLHLDLHPMNVILADDGPVVIDWTNAGAGPAGFDAAITHVIISAYQAENPRDRFAQHVFIRAFRRARGSTAIDAFLGAACDHRLADANLTPDERTAVAELRRKAKSKATRPS